MKKSKVIKTLLETAKDLGMSTLTMREIENLGINETKRLRPNQIKNIRSREKVSQGVMAKILNVTPSTYQKWERGDVEPKGANLKLLQLVNLHGIDYVL